MNNKFKIVSFLSILLSIPLIIVSYYGVFAPSTYSRETTSLAAQGIGQDIVNLFIVTPLLLVSLYLYNNGKKIAYLIFSGTISYILYSFVIYSLGIHFNNLFLLYCAVLGLSIYIFILSLTDLSKTGFIRIDKNAIPHRIIGLFLIIVATLFYLIWLEEIIPAIIGNTVPKSVSDYNVLVNVVHVIDISFALPGIIISAILLLKKKYLGYVLTTVSLVFILLMAVALIGMVIMMKINGIADDISVAIIFAIISLLSFGMLIRIIRNIN